MSFAVEPVFAPYIMPVVAETELDAHQRRAHDEAKRRQSHPHVETPSPEDSTTRPAELESSSLVGRLIDVRA
jgi:hypothetical protein